MLVFIRVKGAACRPGLGSRVEVRAELELGNLAAKVTVQIHHNLKTLASVRVGPRRRSVRLGPPGRIRVRRLCSGLKPDWPVSRWHPLSGYSPAPGSSVTVTAL